MDIRNFWEASYVGRKCYLKVSIFLLFCLSLVELYSQTPLIVNHTAIEKFKDIDENNLSSVARLRLVFRHASVGTTINNGLDCLQGTRSNPKECIQYPPYKYDRRNWKFQPRGNSGWQKKIDDFIQVVRDSIDKYDIFSFKFCYIDGLDETAEPCGKPFNQDKTNSAWNYLKDAYEYLETEFPNKTFIWWTIPLTQVGQYCTEQLNQKIREYCWSNGKILFDIADIEAHDTSGTHCVNPQGWEIAFKDYCGESQPGAQACHPNWLGSILIAKAFWYMMDRISSSISSAVSAVGNDLLVIPNPASNSVRLTLNSELVYPVEVKIFNVLGLANLDLQFLSNSFELWVGDLTQGAYFIVVRSGERIWFSPLIKIE